MHAALSELRSANASLRSQLDQATASSPPAADPSDQVAALQRLLAESQARVAELQAQLEDLRRQPQLSSSQPDAAERSGQEGEQAAVLRAELEALHQTADAAVLERDRLRAQLSRSDTASMSSRVHMYAVPSWQPADLDRHSYISWLLWFVCMCSAGTPECCNSKLVVYCCQTLGRRGTAASGC